MGGSGRVGRTDTYQKAFNRMPKKHILPFTSLDGEVMKRLIEGSEGDSDDKDDERKKRLRKLRPPSRNKTKYTCPGCKANVWGRPELKISCEECKELFESKFGIN